MFIQMENEKIMNLDRVVEIRISDIDDTALKYILNNGEVIIERYEDADAAEAGLLLLQEDPFVLTEDNRLINLDYLKNVKINNVNPCQVEFEMFESAPVKVLYESESEAKEALEEVITDLTTPE